MLGKKIREIREAEGKGRQEFSDLLGIPKQTLINVETKTGNFGVNIVEKLCKLYPKYALWLMTDQTIPENEQISPKIKVTTDDYHKQGKAG